jgi:hypothetical protein
MITAPMFPTYPGAGTSHHGASGSDINAMIRALDGKRTGSGAMVKCPAHDDRNPSLHITLEGGKVLVHCMAGCSQSEVIAALKSRGLWHSAPATPESRKKHGPIVAEYDYRDAAGELLYQVIRYKTPPGEPKDFSQRRPDGQGGWIWRGPADADKVLYHLPEVLEAPIVFCVEGERDVETLREYGFVATTAMCGADAPWLPQYTAALAGREVILIPDRDAPGKAHMAKVARALLGNVARLRYLELDRGKDVTEWFELGGSEVGLISLLEGEEVSL